MPSLRRRVQPPRPPDDGRETRSRAAGQAIRWREWRSRRRVGEARTPRRGPAERRGGRRGGAAGVRARGERREAGQHHAPPRLRRHELRGHAAQRDRDRARARPRRGARRRRHGARRGARRRAASPAATRTSASRCCSRRWPARRWSARAPLRGRVEAVLRGLDAGRRARRLRGDPRGRRGRPRRARRARRPRRADGRRCARRWRAAAGRDAVAAEYARASPMTFDIGLPALRRALDDGLAPRAGDRRDVPGAARRGPRHADRAQARAPRRRSACRPAASAALAAGGVRDEAGRAAVAALDAALRARRQRAQPRDDRRPRDRRALRRPARGRAVILARVGQRAHAGGAGGRTTDTRSSPSTASAIWTSSDMCPSVSIMRDLDGRGGMADLVAAAGRVPADAVVYGAGLENRPDLVARLAAGRTLLGCDPATLRRVRDPVAARRVAARRRPRVPGDARGRRGRAGRRCAALAAQARARRRRARDPVVARRAGARGDVVLQERIVGLPCSVAAVGDGGRPRCSA